MVDDTIKKDQVDNQNVQDIDLGFVEKRRFRINGDYNRMLELNVSDLYITKRLKESYPKLQNLLEEAKTKISQIPDDEDDMKMLGALADSLEEIDLKMREIIDYIFDTNASEICAPSGTMCDPVNGGYRFEWIIGKLATLYSTGLDDEFNKLKNRVENKTKKYTKKSKK